MSTSSVESCDLGVLKQASASVPACLAILVALTVATSSFVMVEPAPCDLLFALMLLVAVLTGHALVPSQLTPPVYIGLYVFVFANILSGMFCEDVSESLRFMAVTIYMVVCFFAIAGLVKRYGTSMLELLIKAYCLAALCAALIGLLARFGLLPHAELFWQDASGHRIQSTFKDANVFAPFLVAAMMLALSRLVSTNRSRIGYFLCVVLYCLGVVMAFSRGAFVHLAVSLFVFVLCQLVVVRQRQVIRTLGRMILLLGLLIVPAVIYVLSQSGQIEYLSTRMSLQKYDQERFGTQALALATVEKVPWGIGAGQWTKARFGRATHNLYLRVLVENGLLGAVGLGLYLAACLWACLQGMLARGRHVHLYVTCLAVLLGILVESIVIDTLHWRHFFFFLAIPVGLQARERLLARRGRSDDEKQGHDGETCCGLTDIRPSRSDR